MLLCQMNQLTRLIDANLDDISAMHITLSNLLTTLGQKTFKRLEIPCSFYPICPLADPYPSQFQKLCMLLHKLGGPLGCLNVAGR